MKRENLAMQEREAQPSNRFKLTAVGVFLGAVLVQCVFLLVLPDTDKANQSTDYVEFYAPVAQNIVDGKGIVTNSGKLASDYPPGFPLYIAANFYLADRLGLARTSLITMANVFLMALSCLLVLRIAEAIFGRRIGLISAFLWITYLFNLWLVKQPNSEVPFLLLFYLAVWCFLRATGKRQYGWLPVAGALLGLAALVRPIALLMPLFLAGLLLLSREIQLGKRLLYGLLIVVAFVLVILPWELKMHSQTGQTPPLSTNGPSSMLDGLTFASKGGKGGNHAWAPESVQALARRVRENQRSLRTTGEVVSFVAGQLRSDPLAVVELGALKVARSWYGTNAMWREKPIALVQFAYLLFIVPGIWLALRRFPDQRFPMMSLLWMVLYFWGMTVIVLSILRYMVPAMGFLLMFLAVLLDTGFARWWRRQDSAKLAA